MAKPIFSKKDLIRSIANELHLTIKEVELIVNKVFPTIIENVGEDSDVRIADFGTSKLRERAARMGRNIQTGEPLQIAASSAIAFKPTKHHK